MKIENRFHIPDSRFIDLVACLFCLALLKLPAKVLVIEASAVGALQTGQSGQLPSCTDSCISPHRIATHAISLIYITAIDWQLQLLARSTEKINVTDNNTTHLNKQEDVINYIDVSINYLMWVRIVS